MTYRSCLFGYVCLTFASLELATGQDSPKNKEDSQKSTATTASTRRQPQPQIRYELEANSKKQDGVPEGKLEGPILFKSRIIENTVRKYWISVPAQYDSKQPACVLVFQDGARAINPNGVLRVPAVLDNLIAKKLIPVTIGIYITPGQRGEEFPESIGTGNPDNRDREYDVLDDNYARMLVEEILPEVGAKYTLTNDPAGRAIGGSSSGGICAFTVAWHQPDQFRNVISLIGSFTNIHGGHVYPQLVRDAPTKPIRIFLQDGIHDLRNVTDPDRDWHLQNQAMVAAFTSKQYDMAHVFGNGGHSDDHGGAILPEMLQWIWRDYPGIKSSSADHIVEQAKRHQSTTMDPFPGFDPKSTISPIGQWKWENNNNRGRRTEVLTIEGDRSQLRGHLETTTIVEGEPKSSSVAIENVEMIGNKLVLDVQREFREIKFTLTLQGIISDKAVVGWSMSEFNGSPRDTAWRADRVTAKPTASLLPIGEFERATDVGTVLNPGSTTYDSEHQTYSVSGSGTNMWNDKDEFQMVWKKLKGDFILDAQAKLIGAGVDPHRKLGWIIRRSLETGSAYADAAVHGDGLTSLQFRRTDGAKTEQVQSAVKGPDVLQLSRKGTKISMAVAKAGEELQGVEGIDLDLGDEVYVGLFVCSHNADVVEKGHFSNVRVTRPAPDSFRPYRDYIGSRLEILDVHSGHRTVVHTVSDSLQAPNWTPDGKYLIYNRNGKLFRFDLNDKSSIEIDTGFANRNNNDHALSFDGKQLGISHHSAEHGGKSMVFSLPVGGGTPKLLTQRGPSYLHGWSPDGQWLIYTGQRNDDLDLFRVSSEGGEEIQLTTAKGVDDGPEFTPDGKTVYFNSTRSGRMQLWKMNSDGSQQVQVTDDQFNNWFPHVSPDGKSLVFLSFAGDINPPDHPFYKPVYLRMQPIAGGPARIIGYLYGGQGTINVNSWSPDNKRIAFVSNSQLSEKAPHE